MSGSSLGGSPTAGSGRHKKALVRLPTVNYDRCGSRVSTDLVREDGTATNEWLRQVIWVLLFGVSAHAVKNALAPAEPYIEKEGLSPALYAVVAVSPLLGSLALPFFWGILYKDHEAKVLVAVPLGQLLGQFLMAAGLWILETKSDSPEAADVAEVLLIVGLVMFSCCHGGAHVVQCAVMARVLPEGLTHGFVATVGMTHVVSVICNFVVPRILAFGGFSAVQAALLIPGVVSSIAGARLAGRSQREGFAVPHTCTPSPEQTQTFAAKLYRSMSEQVLSSHDVEDIDCDTSPLSDRHEQPIVAEKYLNQLGGMSVIWTIGVWKALYQGTVMAFTTVQNLLLVSVFGLTVLQAGSLVATCQMVALLLLPASGFFFELMGRSFLVVAFTWLTFGAMVLISQGPVLGEAVWYGSFMCIAIASTMVPVLGQALVPEFNTRSQGRAYGLLEVLFASAQVCITLTIGLVRQQDGGGFGQALQLFCGVMFLASLASVFTVVSMRRARCSKDTKGSTPLLHDDRTHNSAGLAQAPFG